MNSHNTLKYFVNIMRSTKKTRKLVMPGKVERRDKMDRPAKIYKVAGGSMYAQINEAQYRRS